MKSYTIATKLRDIREDAGLTQAELATVVGTSRQTICSLEKGDYIPSLTLAFLIAKRFKKPVEEVFQLKKK